MHSMIVQTIASAITTSPAPVCVQALKQVDGFNTIGPHFNRWRTCLFDGQAKCRRLFSRWRWREDGDGGLPQFFSRAPVNSRQ